MTSLEKRKLKLLIKKYNPILKESMAIALTEDLFNLIIINKDDTNFELKNLYLEKEQLKNFVIQEFLKINASSITSELKTMEEISFRKKTPFKEN